MIELDQQQDSVRVELTRFEAELLASHAKQEALVLWRQGLRSPRRTVGGQMRVAYRSAEAKLRAALEGGSPKEQS